MQGIALLQQHPLVHEVHLHLAGVDEQKFLALVLLERRVAELGRRLDQERQQAALPHLAGQRGVSRTLAVTHQGLALAMAHQAVAMLPGLLFGEQFLDVDVQRPRQLQRCSDRRRVQTPLDLGQVALGHAGLLGQQLQGNPQFFSQQFQSDRHVTRFSQANALAYDTLCHI
ncbi:hypothetical protein D3C71_1706030 [compost metagenome]